MKNNLLKQEQVRKALYTLFFLLLTVLILTNSQKSLYYALNGLDLWFTKMIPSLFPFMILSGIMIRLKLTEGFAAILYPVLSPIWRVQKNVIYAMIMGFLCGFPMGAKVTCDLLKRDMITEREAHFLLAFCNNIGPVYFLSFVIPLLHRRLLWPYLFGMYGLPFLYGLLLRYTAYRDLSSISSGAGRAEQEHRISGKALTACEKGGADPLLLLEQIDDAITSSIQSILMLGGYMILFNLLNLIPDAITTAPVMKNMGAMAAQLPVLLAPVLEITGGLGMMGDRYPLPVLLLLPFGGLSCIAQTYSMIRGTSLSIHSYVFHKLALTGITAAYYAAWYLLFPGSFLV